jgi:GTP-binding protein EngB required for normal cell division
MTATMTAQLADGTERAGLSARLTALSELVQIGAERTGQDGFGDDLLTAAGDLLTRAGERLMLSARHTVVSLAGGTGSGKSSLFNRLSGADFSTVGITRPVTREAHACVWGVDGSGPLMEWLGVPRRYRYARASALGGGEQSMDGLVLLDLPDHDSVMGHATDLVDELVGLSDLMVWVLDPQKYADAAVHRRFLVPLAGHSEVVAVVLNQADLLTAGQIEDCVHDLRRLLDSEDLPDVQILVTSAKTGAGIEDLRRLLIETVTARHAAIARISADVDKIVARFGPYGAPAAGGSVVQGDDTDLYQDSLPTAVAGELASDFAGAAGVSAIGDALRSARELRALDYVGWPVSWVVERLTSPDPVRKIRLGRLWEELRGITAGPSGAQQAEIDNALTRVADERVPALRKPWSRTVRAAVRSRAEEVPGVIGDEIGAALPAGAVVDRWWRLVGVVQGLLLGCVFVGLAWLIALLILGAGGVGSGMPKLFSDVWLLPWSAVMIVVGLGAGWLTARVCTRAVSDAAETEREQLLEDIRQRMITVAREMVVDPADRELAELDRFRAALRVAAGDGFVR